MRSQDQKCPRHLFRETVMVMMITSRSCTRTIMRSIISAALRISTSRSVIRFSATRAPYQSSISTNSRDLSSLWMSWARSRKWQEAARVGILTRRALTQPCPIWTHRLRETLKWDLLVIKQWIRLLIALLWPTLTKREVKIVDWWTLKAWMSIILQCTSVTSAWLAVKMTHSESVHNTPLQHRLAASCTRGYL